MSRGWTVIHVIAGEPISVYDPAMKPWVVLALVGCGPSGVAGSGKLTSEARPIGGFSEVGVTGAINAEISIGPTGRVELAGDDNLLPLILTELDHEHLKIGNRQGMRPTVPIVARISAPRIGEIDVSGSGSTTLHALHGDNLAIEVSGSGTIRGDGAVHQLRIDLSGSGTVDLAQLPAERATVTVSGSGNVAVAASQALDIHISGSGTVTYRGDPPDVKTDLSGSGRVVKR